MGLRAVVRPSTCCGSLRLVAGYAAGQVADGLGPVEAQCATWQAAEELTEIVMRLRRLAQVDRAGRRGRPGSWPGWVFRGGRSLTGWGSPTAVR